MVLRIYFCFLLLYKCWSLSASLFLQGERVKFVNVWIIYFCVLWAGVFSTLCHHINTVDFTVYVIQHFNTPFHTATVTPYTKIDDALTQPPFLDWSQDHLDALLSLTLLLCWQQKKKSLSRPWLEESDRAPVQRRLTPDISWMSWILNPGNSLPTNNCFVSVRVIFHSTTLIPESFWLLVKELARNPRKGF